MERLSLATGTAENSAPQRDSCDDGSYGYASSGHELRLPARGISGRKAI